MPRRARSFLTTTTSPSLKTTGGGKREGRQDGSFKMSENKAPNVSVFRSPSLEERLATMGIDLGKKKGRVAGVGDDDQSNLSGRSSARSNSAQSMSPSPRGYGRGRRRDDGGKGESSDVSERKSSRLNKDISRRISEISTNMDQYDKNVRNVNETMQEAYRKSKEDQKRNKEGGGGGKGGRLRSKNSSPRIGQAENDSEAVLIKCRESLSKTRLGDDPLNRHSLGDGDRANLIFVGRESPRKVFGLDAAQILKSSSSELSTSEEELAELNDFDKPSDLDSSSEEEAAAAMRVSIKSQKRPSKAATLKRLEENAKNAASARSARSKVKRKKNRRSLTAKMEEFVPRSLSPIMPSLPDKQFQTMLERREERVTRHLTSMKNSLTQLNNKVEMDKKKAEKKGSDSGRSGGSSHRGNTQHSYKGRPLRLMKAEPDKELFSEFNKFMQSTGGKAGGWEGKDHNLFLKTFEIWRNHPKRLLESLKTDLPHKKATEIAAHIKWFERYLELDAKNKANVHKWSQKKRAENELVYQMSSASNRAKLEGDKRRQEHLQRIREQERERNKEKLALWKRRELVRSASSDHGPVEPSKSPSLQRLPRPRPTSGFPMNRETAADKPLPRPTIQTQVKVKPQSEDPRPSPLDIAGVRQHILEITAKVHALDNPKRDFRPPPLPVLPSLKNRRLGSGGKFDINHKLHDDEEEEDIPPSHQEERPWSRSQPRMKPAVGSASEIKSNISKTDSITNIPRSRPRSVEGALRQSRTLSELREQDNRLVEAKKKAIQIARERRTASLNQISIEDIRRRIRSQGPRSTTSRILDPTKQSELRKSLTHLKRLELLSKEDLKRGGATRPPSRGSLSSHPPLPQLNQGQLPTPNFGSNSFIPSNISQVTKKNIPSWRLLGS